MAATRLTVSLDERTRLAEARLGQVLLGKWRLIRLIGVGGMAAVFEATQPNGSRVAIKVLHRDLAGLNDARARFLAEGYAANRAAHPGVVAVRDEGTTDDGAVFLVMELLRGKTLAERCARGREPLSVAAVLELASQLLDVLVHAHDRGIVHRDIKPQNVFLTDDGRVRLLDFGIARIETRAHTHTSEAGTTLGTPAFMPPEQALGRWAELDGRSDLWSLGATLYLLLSGQPVRQPGTATEQLLGAMTRPVPSLADVAALPRCVVAVVDRALAFDREARFPDARSMQLAVHAVQDELRGPDSRTTLPPVSLEPVALSLCTPRPDARRDRPSAPTMRAVAAAITAPESAGAKPARNALLAYITLGFAVGIGIVLAARLTLRPSPATSYAAQPARVELPPSPSALLSSAAPHNSGHAPREPITAPTVRASPSALGPPTPARVPPIAHDRPRKIPQ